jgi:hypothetical protein
MAELQQAAGTWPERLRQSGRVPAALIHVALSVSAVGLLAGVMLAWLFPMPYFVFDGGWRVLKILILVDVCLGPILTFIVFRRGKPGLVRDLAVIAALQAAAFVYGAATLIVHRTAFLVYHDRNFYAVTLPQAKEGSTDRARLEPLRGGQAGPIFVYLDLPYGSSPRGRADDVARMLNVPLIQLGDYYQLVDARGLELMTKDRRDMEVLAKDDPAIARDLQKFRERHPQQPLSAFLFLPIGGRDGVAMGAFDPRSGALVDWML